MDSAHTNLHTPQLVYGSIESLDREYNHVYVASAVLEQILEYLEEGGDEYYEGTHKHPLVICSRTRADVVIALLAAHYTGVGPPVAGVLTTGKAEYGSHSAKVCGSPGRLRGLTTPAVCMRVCVCKPGPHTL